MAKFECALQGDFNEILKTLDSGIISGSASASFEDGSDFGFGTVRCAVRVYERYSMIGGNRVSLNVTLIGEGNNVMLSAITSGGSQAIFFKINTFGENAFLDCVRDIVQRYQAR
jgi:hypothetical protein